MAAVVLSGLVIGLSGDAHPPSVAEQNDPAIVPHGGESSAGLLPDDPCALVELSDTLVHVNCAGSWAAMRWNGRWEFDGGQNESEAVAFFNASDVARKVFATMAPEPVADLTEQAEAKPEPLPQQDQPVAPAASPPAPLPPRPAAPRAATVKPPPPPPPQETPLPRKQCTVSRPKPGFQVYLVTCPSSQVTIGRTVDSANGWTVSESVNGTEAIEFFMKSPYAR